MRTQAVCNIEITENPQSFEMDTHPKKTFLSLSDFQLNHFLFLVWPWKEKYVIKFASNYMLFLVKFIPLFTWPWLVGHKKTLSRIKLRTLEALDQKLAEKSSLFN